ncbi:MAG: hypothetical protein IT318_04155 [Anaerolineales bacterium]|nr:hypothetical protein [Anaerolineales bacterium]
MDATVDGMPAPDDSRGLVRPDKQVADFEAAHGEPLANVLNLDTWTPGEDLLSAYGRLEQEVAEAVAQQKDVRKVVRDRVFGRIASGPAAPPNAGVYQAKRADLERIHKGLLFNGGVEACDGTNVVHDTIPLTITQIGVCLVAYNGRQGSWAHRLFRRDLRSRAADPVDEALAVLERRQNREAVGTGADPMSELARRGIMAYAERAILKEKSTAQWRMGHGSPAPYELLTNLWSSKKERIRVALDLIEWYVQYKRFVFVPSAPAKRHWLTIGDALQPTEFAILQTLQPEVERYLDTGGYRDGSGVKPEIESFCREVAPKIVVGLFRVWEGAPPYLFYAHVDQAEMAAHIAMADAMLQEHRGFPMLIDLADTVCGTVFGQDSFNSSVQLAYTDAGEPFRYLGERDTRY